MQVFVSVSRQSVIHKSDEHLYESLRVQMLINSPRKHQRCGILFVFLALDRGTPVLLGIFMCCFLLLVLHTFAGVRS